ncbi:unnamed protein product [Penicillium salamii]|uniref:Zn(2)-C6 fungal-type domain-containing protein n=1 Tax=Penicillium salamii TaxID=1612424 RepID=A0A9W4NUZ8_9EURO|nr:unnamed protein product [Penicillium salamii]CAG8333207.1 unnamed protein product [Penicillium salamii]CAG8359937.1 unnamed protein product [Penicillium salamii]CAG8371874.1 unnamed protein product [Penicillium salamii]CAG8412534.1 unnamed protein product [Penicillium salamii]
MAIRRSHTKSRLGCLRCRDKHLKCDEVRPTCGACEKYNQPCILKPTKNTRSTSTQHVNINHGRCTTLTETSTTQSFPDSSRAESLSGDLLIPSQILSANTYHREPPKSVLTTWEFDLIHHWIINVTDTFAVSQAFHRSWQDQGVRESMRYPFILHMILMLSALHLGITKSPNFSEKHSAFILSGCSDAMASFRKEAEFIDDSNCHAVGKFPFLLSIYALALPLLQAGDKTEDTILDEMIHIMVLMKGNGTIHETTKAWRKTRDLKSWLEDKDILDDAAHLSEDNDLDFAIAELQHFIDLSDDSLAVRGSNTRALQSLQQSLDLRLKRGLRPLAWPNAVDHDYMDLLRQRNTASLAILAHYAVILAQCNSRWWCLDWGVQLASAIERLMPDEHIAIILYPLRKLHLR